MSKLLDYIDAQTLAIFYATISLRNCEFFVWSYENNKTQEPFKHFPAPPVAKSVCSPSWWMESLGFDRALTSTRWMSFQWFSPKQAWIHDGYQKDLQSGHPSGLTSGLRGKYTSLPNTNTFQQKWIVFMSLFCLSFWMWCVSI